MKFSSSDLMCLVVATVMPQVMLMDVSNSCPDMKERNDSFGLEFQEPNYSTVKIYKLGEPTRLNCYAYNFCNISWHHGKGVNLSDPYPWDDSSVYSTNLLENGQFLQFQDECGDTNPIYTCVVSNGTHQITRTINTLGGGHDPQPSILTPTDSCHNQTACIGDHVFFNCSFQLISANKPPLLKTDWYYQSWDGAEGVHVKWRMANTSINYDVTNTQNSSESSNDEGVCGSRAKSTIVSRLDFTVSNEDAYGIYILQVIVESNSKHIIELTSGPECKPAIAVNNLRSILGSIGAFLCLLCMIIIVVKAVSLNIKVWYKDAFGVLEIDDGKRYDAYISYNNGSQEDRIFATQTLREHLMNKLGYSVCVPDINIIPGTDIIEEISHALDASRRFILIISPHYLDSMMASNELDIAMDRFSDSPSCVIPILFQRVTDEQGAESKMLGHAMKSCIHWGSMRFFKELQLRMPPRTTSTWTKCC
ncbi:single Ig IL-1-related receptor-like [Amphiura filiformis]|uniref:single Ig IL-1-related receptor-like n=1 Tax=Amphiura filiformis TaxID=82378 RepID=UPI003B216691